MTRHIIDKPREASTERADRYLKLDRQDTPHPSVRSLQQRQRAEAAGRRVKEFARIDRGHRV